MSRFSNALSLGTAINFILDRFNGITSEQLVVTPGCNYTDIVIGLLEVDSDTLVPVSCELASDLQGVVGCVVQVSLEMNEHGEGKHRVVFRLLWNKQLVGGASGYYYGRFTSCPEQGETGSG